MIQKIEYFGRKVYFQVFLFTRVPTEEHALNSRPHLWYD